jgi:hypothetical protein
LEKHYVSRRSQREKGILVFVARDAAQRVLCYGNAGIPNEDQADEVLRFVACWEQPTGKAPEERGFDAQWTTYANRSERNRRGIRFLTLRRRARKMRGQIFRRPASAWQRITLAALSRTFGTPKVLDERTRLKGYPGELRQGTGSERGPEEPTRLLTNDFRVSGAALVTRYAQRLLIENGRAEAIGFFPLDARSSLVGLKGDFDLQITRMARSLYRLMAERVGRA